MSCSDTREVASAATPHGCATCAPGGRLLGGNVSPPRTYSRAMARRIAPAWSPAAGAGVGEPRDGEPSRAPNTRVPCRGSAAPLDGSGSDRFASTGVSP
jgi:hypothetical protein